MRPLSARNPRVQRLARLVRRREERDRERALVVEGPTLLAAALDAGLPVRDVFVDEAAAERAPVGRVLARLGPESEPWSLPAGVLDRVATAPQGVVAVVERPEAGWPTPEQARFVLVLAEVADPGNAGTLLRAAVAAGAGAVVVVGGADPTGPKVLRASAGAAFAVPVLAAPEVRPALDRLRSDGYRTVAAVVRGGEPYDTVDLTGPVALVVGNEAHGLDAEAVAAVDVRTTIPMAGPTESLNVAMAGTLLCFEVLRRGR